MTNIATLLPNGKQTFYDANGVPLVGGLVYFYIPNTDTLKNTWQDAEESTLNTNPVELDSLGSALIYGEGQYRQLVKDVDGNTIWDELTADPLYPLATQEDSVTGGATLVAYLPPGASEAETVYDKLAQTISVKDFGAVGDDATDDTDAINDAIASLAGVGGSVYFPHGIYVTTAAITVTNMNISLIGEGEGVSVIKVTAPVDALNITQNSARNFTSISGLSFRTTELNVGNCITIDYSAASTSGVPLDRCSINNVEIRGVGGAGEAGFQYGIVMTDCTNTRINGYTFIGYQSASTQAGRLNAVAAIKLTGANDPVETFIHQCKAYFCQKAVEIIGTCEGIYVEQCAFIEVGRGVEWHQASGNRPLLSVTNSHINCYTYGVYGSHLAQIIVSGNLIYKSSIATTTTVGVYMEQAIGGIISENILINAGGAGDFNGIAIGTSATDFIVSDNTLDGTITTGIWFLASSSNNIARGNTFPGSYTTAYLDSGTHNAVGRRGVLAYISADQSTSTGVDTAIAWDAVKYDSDGFWSSGANFVIPSGAAIKRIRLSASAAWQGNATGQRVMTVQKNSAGTYAGRCGQSAAVGGISDSFFLNASGAIIDVADGDVFRLVMSQSSGGGLNALGSERTWLSIEVIE